MFNLTRSKDIEKFAAELAREFAGRCAPDKAHADKGSTAQLARAIDEVCSRATAYRREHKLGMYGKAKLATTFKLELKEIGYSADFIDALTRQLVLKMSAT
ncbi:MAG TPA: hypothetical protein VHL85_13040 [Burkholderiales bacterium]|jgi:hypothetical protein|nr:hypothetical protein [Burkholderiales bacterium]